MLFKNILLGGAIQIKVRIKLFLKKCCNTIRQNLNNSGQTPVLWGFTAYQLIIKVQRLIRWITPRIVRLYALLFIRYTQNLFIFPNAWKTGCSKSTNKINVKIIISTRLVGVLCTLLHNPTGLCSLPHRVLSKLGG